LKVADLEGAFKVDVLLPNDDVVDRDGGRLDLIGFLVLLKTDVSLVLLAELQRGAREPSAGRLVVPEHVPSLRVLADADVGQDGRVE